MFVNIISLFYYYDDGGYNSAATTRFHMCIQNRVNHGIERGGVVGFGVSLHWKHMHKTGIDARKHTCFSNEHTSIYIEIRIIIVVAVLVVMKRKA